MTRSALHEPRDAYLLGVLRVAVSCLLLLFTLKLARQLALVGYFGDVFHLPLVPQGWVAGRATYTLMLAVAAVACVLSGLGIYAKPALLLAGLLHLYGFFSDRLQYHNNRYALLLLVCLVALSPCDRSLLLWRRLRGQPQPAYEERLAPRLFALAIGAQLSLVYLASSLGKALDPDWRGGTVMRLRFAEGHAFLSQYLPQSLVDLLQAPWFAHAASVTAIASELFIAIGPWVVRTRPLALWLGVVFHLGIQVSANVELFSYTMLCGYIAFVKPELRERTLTFSADARGQQLRKVLSGLDWLKRFRLQTVEQRHVLGAIDRAGRAHTGLSAWRELCRGLPALFPLWLPLALVTWRRR